MLERFQVPLYFLAIALGALGAFVWGSDAFSDMWVDGLLFGLMFVTFLSVPLHTVAGAIQDVRFGAALLALNFLLVPVVVFVISRLFTDSPLLVGLVLVLICPCVDYVIVFSRLAGGDADRLVAWAPILLVVQMLAMPLLLWLIADHSMAAEAGPFWRAFRLFIIAPLILAAIVQRFAKTQVGKAIDTVGKAAMVPLMMGVLAAVVATQLDTVREFGGQLGWLIPAYLAFAVLVGVVSWGVGSRFSRPQQTALTFSAVTRNSLIIMPFALAIGGITPAVVLTQTMVELLVMVAMVALLPRLLPR